MPLFVLPTNLKRNQWYIIHQGLYTCHIAEIVLTHKLNLGTQTCRGVYQNSKSKEGPIQYGVPEIYGHSEVNICGC